MRYATLALALILAGCHDYVVDPIDPVDPVAEPGSELPRILLKGPSRVAPGDTPRYKADSSPFAASYRFQLRGNDYVLESRDSDDDRYFYTSVVAEGRIEILVTAYDEEGNAIGFNSREIVSSTPAE